MMSKITGKGAKLNSEMNHSITSVGFGCLN